MTIVKKLVMPLAVVGLSFGQPAFAADGTRASEALPHYSAVQKLAESKASAKVSCVQGTARLPQGSRSECSSLAAAPAAGAPYASFMGGGGAFPIALVMLVVGVAGVVALASGGSDSPG